MLSLTPQRPSIAEFSSPAPSSSPLISTLSPGISPSLIPPDIPAAWISASVSPPEGDSPPSSSCFYRPLDGPQLQDHPLLGALPSASATPDSPLSSRTPQSCLGADIGVAVQSDVEVAAAASEAFAAGDEKKERRGSEWEDGRGTSVENFVENEFMGGIGSPIIRQEEETEEEEYIMSHEKGEVYRSADINNLSEQDNKKKPAIQEPEEEMEFGTLKSSVAATTTFHSETVVAAVSGSPESFLVGRGQRGEANGVSPQSVEEKDINEREVMKEEMEEGIEVKVEEAEERGDVKVLAKLPGAVASTPAWAKGGKAASRASVAQTGPASITSGVDEEFCIVEEIRRKMQDFKEDKKEDGDKENKETEEEEAYEERIEVREEECILCEEGGRTSSQSVSVVERDLRKQVGTSLIPKFRFVSFLAPHTVQSLLEIPHLYSVLSSVSSFSTLPSAPAPELVEMVLVALNGEEPALRALAKYTGEPECLENVDKLVYPLACGGGRVLVEVYKYALSQSEEYGSIHAKLHRLFAFLQQARKAHKYLIPLVQNCASYLPFLDGHFDSLPAEEVQPLPPGTERLAMRTTPGFGCAMELLVSLGDTTFTLAAALGAGPRHMRGGDTTCGTVPSSAQGVSCEAESWRTYTDRALLSSPTGGLVIPAPPADHAADYSGGEVRAERLWKETKEWIDRILKIVMPIRDDEIHVTVKIENFRAASAGLAGLLVSQRSSNPVISPRASPYWRCAIQRCQARTARLEECMTKSRRYCALLDSMTRCLAVSTDATSKTFCITSRKPAEWLENLNILLRRLQAFSGVRDSAISALAQFSFLLRTEQSAVETASLTPPQVTEDAHTPSPDVVVTVAEEVVEDADANVSTGRPAVQLDVEACLQSVDVNGIIGSSADFSSSTTYDNMSLSSFTSSISRAAFSSSSKMSCSSVSSSASVSSDNCGHSEEPDSTSPTTARSRRVLLPPPRSLSRVSTSFASVSSRATCVASGLACRATVSTLLRPPFSSSSAPISFTASSRSIRQRAPISSELPITAGRGRGRRATLPADSYAASTTSRAAQVTGEHGAGGIRRRAGATAGVGSRASGAQGGISRLSAGPRIIAAGRSGGGATAPSGGEPGRLRGSPRFSGNPPRKSPLVQRHSTPPSVVKRMRPDSSYVSRHMKGRAESAALAGADFPCPAAAGFPISTATDVTTPAATDVGTPVAADLPPSAATQTPPACLTPVQGSPSTFSSTSSSSYCSSSSVTPKSVSSAVAPLTPELVTRVACGLHSGPANTRVCISDIPLRSVVGFPPPPSPYFPPPSSGSLHFYPLRRGGGGGIIFATHRREGEAWAPVSLGPVFGVDREPTPSPPPDTSRSQPSDPSLFRLTRFLRQTLPATLRPGTPGAGLASAEALAPGHGMASSLAGTVEHRLSDQPSLPPLSPPHPFVPQSPLSAASSALIKRLSAVGNAASPPPAVPYATPMYVSSAATAPARTSAAEPGLEPSSPLHVVNRLSQSCLLPSSLPASPKYAALPVAFPPSLSGAGRGVARFDGRFSCPRSELSPNLQGGMSQCFTSRSFHPAVQCHARLAPGLGRTTQRALAFSRQQTYHHSGSVHPRSLFPSYIPTIGTGRSPHSGHLMGPPSFLPPPPARIRPAVFPELPGSPALLPSASLSHHGVHSSFSPEAVTSWFSSCSSSSFLSSSSTLSHPTYANVTPLCCQKVTIDPVTSHPRSRSSSLSPSDAESFDVMQNSYQ